MANKYLDYNGLSYFWGKVKNLIDTKELPVDGVSGQILKKTDSGSTWSDPIKHDSNIRAMGTEYVLNEPIITYLTTQVQMLNDEEKMQVKENIGFTVGKNNGLTLLTISVTGLDTGFSIQVKDENNNILGEQTVASKTYFIKEGTKYYVIASNVDNYITPDVVMQVAGAWTEQSINMNYIDNQHTGTKEPTNGVYIQDIDGYYHTESEWTGKYTPNGIALITDNCRFVVALNDIGSMLFSYDNEIEDYDIPVVFTDNEAYKQYNGLTMTDKIVNTIGASSNYAAPKCKQYKFPNGTVGYLGAVGEWKSLYNNKSAVASAMSKCGGTTLTTGNYWTSTLFYDGDYDWTLPYYLSWRDGSISESYEAGRSSQVRAFMAI